MNSVNRWHVRALTGLSLVLLLSLTTACNGETHWPAQSRVNVAVMNLVDPDSMCLVEPAVANQATSPTSFLVLLTTGLLTGLSHCVGMCGPLVGAFAMRRRAERLELSTPLVLFQMGRLTTYILLGALLGALGQIAAAVIRDWQGFVSIGLGLLMALLGLSLLGLLPLQRWLASAVLTRMVGRWMRRLMTARHPLAPFGLGLTNGLLPCGPIYAIGLLVAISGDPLRGATIMLVFGLGTLPAMLGLGFSISLLSIRLRTSLYRLAAMLVTLVGVQLALRGLAVSGQVAHAAVGGVMLW